MVDVDRVNWGQIGLILCHYQSFRRRLNHLEHLTDAHKRRKENRQPVMQYTVWETRHKLITQSKEFYLSIGNVWIVYICKWIKKINKRGTIFQLGYLPLLGAYM